MRKLAVDSTVVTQHIATINGTPINYTATTGTMPVWDDMGKPIASLFYTYYARDTKGDLSNRPLVISFNGGPGSASVWMHIAYTGPKVLKIDDEGYPMQPYGIQDNPHSILDVADIVFVNPANTGYSRTIPESGSEVDKKLFFGINADIKYLADWLNTFVTRYNRWLSPKYIIGESYGGTRVMGLSQELQDRQWMYLNGVILVSPADYKSYGADNALSSALNIPYMTAAAWHHKVLPSDLQSKDLTEVLPEVEKFAIDELLPALAKGGFITEKEKMACAEKLERYTTISQKNILQHNLSIPTSYFWKELLRDESGMTIGRLDSRYLGLDMKEAGQRPEYNAELKSWLHSFTPAINYYIREHLNYKTDIKYNMFGPVNPWDRTNDNTRASLGRAMNQNPYLNVLVQSGYYDGATTYFNAKYTMWQIDPSGKMRDRLHFKGYRSGHMMYLRREDLKLANDDLREFIINTQPGGKSAKY
jgi:carboxypeptidase C (cathepsin A)